MGLEIGWAAESQRRLVRQADRNQGRRDCATTSDRQHIKGPERESSERKRASEILCTASANIAWAELDYLPPAVVDGHRYGCVALGVFGTLT